MTDAELRAIRDWCEKATPGPWTPMVESEEQEYRDRFADILRASFKAILIEAGDWRPLSDHILFMVRAEVAAEREECAKVAEQVWDSGQEGAHGGEQANRTAAAIRARGKQ